MGKEDATYCKYVFLIFSANYDKILEAATAVGQMKEMAIQIDALLSGISAKLGTKSHGDDNELLAETQMTPSRPDYEILDKVVLMLNNGDYDEAAKKLMMEAQNSPLFCKYKELTIRVSNRALNGNLERNVDGVAIAKAIKALSLLQGVYEKELLRKLFVGEVLSPEKTASDIFSLRQIGDLLNIDAGDLIDEIVQTVSFKGDGLLELAMLLLNQQLYLSNFANVLFNRWLSQQDGFLPMARIFELSKLATSKFEFSLPDAWCDELDKAGLRMIPEESKLLFVPFIREYHPTNTGIGVEVAEQLLVPANLRCVHRI